MKQVLCFRDISRSNFSGSELKTFRLAAQRLHHYMCEENMGSHVKQLKLKPYALGQDKTQLLNHDNIHGKSVF